MRSKAVDNGRRPDEEYFDALERVADEMREAMTGLNRAIARLELAIDQAKKLKENHANP